VSLLQAEKVTRTYGTRMLFEDISIGIDEGQKIALVAKNGSGKSTLLKMLAGLDIPDRGEVNSRKGIKIGYLAQQPEFDDENTVLETILNSETPSNIAIRNYEYWLDQHSQNHTQASESELQKALETMDHLNAWELENNIKTILTRFKISFYDKKVKELSGGQKKRLALCILLINVPDIIILDEPTNHLDIEMIEWLENFLSQNSITLFMVTHDRYFLDKVCNEIIELDEGKIFRYKGNYKYFLEKKSERRMLEISSVEKARNLYLRELEWMRRQPKARGSKSKSRVEAFETVERDAKRKTGDEAVELSIKMNRVGGKILELKNISKKYGDNKLISNFTYTVKRNDRIGIAGANGTGKSTLLKIITGQIKPDSGKVVLGETVIPGYYSQEGLSWKEDKKVIDVVREIAEYIPLNKGGSLTASQLLQKFLFSPSQHQSYVSKLSGGELKRLYLLTVLIGNPNLLILDEPTNDLDLLTLNVLEEFLNEYEGVLIVVSHDRYFMDTLTDHLFVFEGDGIIKDFNGNYTDYRIDKSESAQLNKSAMRYDPVMGKGDKSNEQNKTPKLTYKEKIELESLQKEIAELEEEKENLEIKMSSGLLKHTEIMEAGKRFEMIHESIEEKTLRWLEIEDRLRN